MFVAYNSFYQPCPNQIYPLTPTSWFCLQLALHPRLTWPWAYFGLAYLGKPTFIFEMAVVEPQWMNNLSTCVFMHDLIRWNYTNTNNKCQNTLSSTPICFWRWIQTKHPDQSGAVVNFGCQIQMFCGLRVYVVEPKKCKCKPTWYSEYIALYIQTSCFENRTRY